MMKWAAIFILIWATAANACDPPDAAARSPFSRAELAPADATLFIQVEHAAKLRAELADRPLARWLNALGKDGQGRKAWEKFAAAAGLSEAELFDALAGKSATLIVRAENEWSFITQVDAERGAKLMQRLKVRVREPRHQFAVAELPEQDVIVARAGEVMVIGPAKQIALFDETLQRLNQSLNAAASLTSTIAPTLKSNGYKPRTSGDLPTVDVFVRHTPAIGGFSLATFTVNGDHVALQHAAKFEHAPFTRGVTKLTSDFSPVLLFERHALMAMMQPTDVGDGPVEVFVTAALGEGFVSPPMRNNLGDRRLIVVNEAEGRQLERPVDLLSTTVVCGMQVKNREAAIDQLDAQMMKVSRRINDLGNGAFLVKLPNVSRLRPHEPREVDMSGASDWFTGGFPIMKNLTLTWTVADGPHGAWFIVGSHRGSVDDVVGVLSREDQNAEAQKLFAGKFDSAGTSNGFRIGRHLRSWCDRAEEFAEPERVEDFRSTLLMMSELASGMKTCRWQLERPTAQQMRLNVQIELAPPESARE